MDAMRAFGGPSAFVCGSLLADWAATVNAGLGLATNALHEQPHHSQTIIEKLARTAATQASPLNRRVAPRVARTSWTKGRVRLPATFTGRSMRVADAASSRGQSDRAVKRYLKRREGPNSMAGLLPAIDAIGQARSDDRVRAVVESVPSGLRRSKGNRS